MVPDQAFKEGVDHGIFKLIWDTAQGYCYRLINYRNSNCIVLYYNSNFFCILVQNWNVRIQQFGTGLGVLHMQTI